MTDLFQAGRLLATGIEGEFTRERQEKISMSEEAEDTLILSVQVKLQE